MTAEEELAQLKNGLAAEQAKNAQLRQLLEEVLRRLGGVEGRLAKDGHNNNKSPSSDGLLHKQGHCMLAALAAVFAGQPSPVAWAPM